MKIAGRRVGPGEIEAALIEHPAVSEAAAIGVPDALKGTDVVCFVVLQPGRRRERSAARRAGAGGGRRARQGRPAQGGAVRRRPAQDAQRQDPAPADPARATSARADLGDLSSVANPEALDKDRRRALSGTTGLRRGPEPICSSDCTGLASPVSAWPRIGFDIFGALLYLWSPVDSLLKGGSACLDRVRRVPIRM